MADQSTEPTVTLARAQWERIIEALEWDIGWLGREDGDFDLAQAIRAQVSATP